LTKNYFQWWDKIEKDDFKLEETLLYEWEEGSVTIEMSFDGKTLWTTQKTMGRMFNVTVPTINEHLKKNIFKTDELYRWIFSY